MDDVSGQANRADDQECSFSLFDDLRQSLDTLVVPSFNFRALETTAHHLTTDTETPHPSSHAENVTETTLPAAAPNVLDKTTSDAPATDDPASYDESGRDTAPGGSISDAPEMYSFASLFAPEAEEAGVGVTATGEIAPASGSALAEGTLVVDAGDADPAEADSAAADAYVTMSSADDTLFARDVTVAAEADVLSPSDSAAGVTLPNDDAALAATALDVTDDLTPFDDDDLAREVMGQLDAPAASAPWDDIELLDEDEPWEEDAEPAPRTLPAARRYIPARGTLMLPEAWLYNVCVPDLRAKVAERGFISLHELARALHMLGNDERLGAALMAALDHDDVRVTRSVAHTISRVRSLALAERLFAPLLARPPYPRDVLRYLKMDHLSLSDETLAFVLQAFELHRLTRHTERALLERLIAARVPGVPYSAREADPEAWQALFHDNLWLVCRTAASYTGRGLEIEDLIQEGALGLMVGLERCDIDVSFRSYRLMHYIWTWIAQRISRAICDKGSVVRVPVHFEEIVQRVRTFAAREIDERGVPPTPEQCAAALDLPDDVARRALAHVKGPIFFGAVTARQQELALRRDQGIGDDDDDTFETVSQRQLREAIDAALGTLMERERDVLTLRYGLDGNREHTLEAVGRHLGVTRERARQIEATALKKLMNPSRADRLRDWYSTMPAKPSQTDEDAAAWHAMNKKRGHRAIYARGRRPRILTTQNALEELESAPAARDAATAAEYDVPNYGAGTEAADYESPTDGAGTEMAIGSEPGAGAIPVELDGAGVWQEAGSLDARETTHDDQCICWECRRTRKTALRAQERADARQKLARKIARERQEEAAKPVAHEIGHRTWPPKSDLIAWVRSLQDYV